MKFNSVFLSSLLAFSLSPVAMSANVETTKPEKPERWFEIEVILFKQLGNKAALKEQFPEGINASNLPSYKQTFDLFTPYLQPNLTSIKYFLPHCSEKGKQPLFLEAQPNINVLSLNKEPYKASNEMPNMSEALSSQAEVDPFKLDLQKEALAKPIFSTENLCIITQNEMESLFDEKQLTDFNIDSFGVDALPNRLNASGTHNSNAPYLIADESLLLKDIGQRLRWSKEFQPLLHFGWRQVGITKKQAIPLKLFAGEHLGYKYQQNLTEYKTEINTARIINQRVNQTNEVNRLVDNTNIAPVSAINLHDTEQEVKTEQKQQALNQLFSHIEFINSNDIDNNAVSNIINDIVEQNLDSILASNEDRILLGDQLVNMGNPPKKPLQPWFLDGLIKIHLDHYLYINANFNIFNQNNVKMLIEDDKTNNVKLINFSQNRRVITGEIHYFDHPYIGMIIQIRRFDPTKPVGEQVSQAIK